MVTKAELFAQLAPSRPQQTRSPGAGVAKGLANAFNVYLRAQQQERQDKRQDIADARAEEKFENYITDRTQGLERQDIADTRAAEQYRQGQIKFENYEEAVKYAKAQREILENRQNIEHEQGQADRRTELIAGAEKQRLQHQFATTAAPVTNQDMRDAASMLTNMYASPAALAANAAKIDPEFKPKNVQARAAVALGKTGWNAEEGEDPLYYLKDFYELERRKMEVKIAETHMTPKHITQQATMFANADRLQKHPDNIGAWKAIKRAGVATDRILSLAKTVGSTSVVTANSGHLMLETPDGIEYFSNQVNEEGVSRPQLSQYERAHDRYSHWHNKLTSLQGENYQPTNQKDSTSMQALLNEPMPQAPATMPAFPGGVLNSIKTKPLNALADEYQRLVGSMVQVPTPGEKAFRDNSFTTDDGAIQFISPTTQQISTVSDPAAQYSQANQDQAAQEKLKIEGWRATSEAENRKNETDRKMLDSKLNVKMKEWQNSQKEKSDLTKIFNEANNDDTQATGPGDQDIFQLDSPPGETNESGQPVTPQFDF